MPGRAMAAHGELLYPYDSKGLIASWYPLTKFIILDSSRANSYTAPKEMLQYCSMLQKIYIALNDGSQQGRNACLHWS